MVEGDSSRVAQYIRVSSDEQAKRGFSIPDQKRELDLWAEAGGCQVVACEVDDGYESWVLERPGLDRIRDLVEAGSIDTVVITRRDRLSREPAHLWVLEKEFRDNSVQLIALNVQADDTPEGQLTTGVLDQLSKYERLVLKERTRRGTLQKVRSGKVIVGNRVNYGFKPNATRDGYEVNEETAPIVQRIFDMVANGERYMP
jgi:site-specific DNA recombinase